MSDAVQFTLDPDVDAARRIAFTIVKAAAALEIPHHPDLSLGAQLEHVLQAAMERPWAISPEIYGMIFTLAGAQQHASNS
ncbi:hypothetical protein [Bradyrhizobium sp. BR 10289]|uniref:hypothetical protein n=1 Tax=Bradyrhizobium sp. BR 10289 TaxID=2749993 RepID=UPI001C64C839|nr:hypothetical protein [Bradyrhizobium sp. BR 10289]MBW7968612.1 hypothetical protein [Bradyrhizobium sp. BR 10289]